MPCCCVPRCTNRSETKKKGTDGITFHLFPRDAAKRRRWSAAVGRDGWRPSSASVVCSHHFPAACFYRTRGGLVRLLDHSLPVLHVPPARENTSDSPWEPNNKCEDAISKSQKELELGINGEDTENQPRGASDTCDYAKSKSQKDLELNIINKDMKCEDRESRDAMRISRKGEDVNGESRGLGELAGDEKDARMPAVDAVQISGMGDEENSKSRRLAGDEKDARRPAVLRAPFLEPGAPAKARALAAHVLRMQQLLRRQRKSIRQLQRCLRERRARLRDLQRPVLRDGDDPERDLCAEETSDFEYSPGGDTLEVSFVS